MNTAKSENRVHLFRLQTLIIDGGLLVLRQVLDCKLQVQNTTLAGCLVQEKGIITRLKAQKTITQVQYDLLYPPGGGQAPSTSDLDITLIICLLRNLKTCGLNKRFNWNVIPQTGDTSIEGDMYRLKQFRNEIAHISSTTGIDLKNFNSKWTEIEQILIRLNSAVHNPVPNLHQTVNEIKTSPVDPEAEKRIDKAIEEWREKEKGLEVDVELIKTGMKEFRKHTSENENLIKDVQSTVTEWREKEKGLEVDVELIKTGIKEVKKDTSENEKLIKDVQSTVTNLVSQISEAQEETRRKHRELREDLIRFYTSEHRTILLDPLFEQKDTPLVNFYVMPDMNIIGTQGPLSHEEVKSQIGSLSDVFSFDGKFSHNIYLTADAGLGKTAFSKYLAVTWCEAHRENSEYTEYFDENDLNVMRQFELLFLVFLRHSSSDCSIDDMILKQIIKNTPYSCTMEMQSLQHILARKRHLVILDGLDEWTHPERECAREPKTIPHRNARENYVILTTTRPWKLGVINLKTSQIDKKMELAKLSSVSAKLLKERAISKIMRLDVGEARNLVEDFNAKVTKCSLGDLESVPLLLIYLIYLWYNEIPLGQSKCGLYTSITELLLSRTVKKYPHLKFSGELSQKDFPQCFNEHKHCRKYFSLLTSLGRLAFHTLFCETRESTLVFDKSVSREFLSKSQLKLSRQSGIITQSKVQVKSTQSSKISFAHKTVQEYFSALYMSCQSERDVLKIIQENCRSLQDILDMSAVFVFISGMNGEVMSTISRELMSVINKDKITSIHRSVIEYVYSSPLKDIQNMYISCIKENPDNNNLKLCLQDFIIDRECREENYNTTLQHLAKHNRNNIKSLRVDNTCLGSLHEIIDSFALSDLTHLQKIDCHGVCHEADIISLLSGTVKYASVTTFHRCSMTSALCRRFHNLLQLEGIYIKWFHTSHAILEEFLNYTNRKSMKQIRLQYLSCTDHGYSCDGVKLDLSQHTELRTLELEWIPLSQLNINVASLEKFDARLSKPGLASSYLSQLSAASKLNTLKCGDIQSPGDIETLLQILPLLVHVKEVKLENINLGERSLRLSPQMINIEYIELVFVTMPSSSFRDLVKHVEQVPHSVKVEIWDCNITPETECKIVTQYVRTSENFVVKQDGKNGFVFLKSAVATTTSD